MSIVQILLSTYNGEKYLEEQLDSLLAQDYPSLEILIRDDGSTDGTRAILDKYSKRFPNIKLIYGQNLGVVKSFFELLKLASSEVGYIAFCDQDDVWMKDKVSRAVNILEQQSQNIPLLYCSRLVLVDESLHVIGQTKTPKKCPSFENALVQNIATGCTIVINKASKQLLAKEFPTVTGMHDWWIYLVISAFGKVIYDPVPKILYRQHSSNVIGHKKSSIARWTKRINRFLNKGDLYLITEQAIEFKRIFGSILPNEKKKILNRFINGRKNFWDRLYYSLSSDVYRQSVVDDIILKLLIIMNRV